MLEKDATDEALLGGAPLAFPELRSDGDNIVDLYERFKKYCEQQAQVKATLLEKLVADTDELSMAFREAANEFTHDGETEVDPDAIVSLSEELGDDITGLRGAYVQGWFFVRMGALPEHLQRTHGARLSCAKCGKSYPCEDCDEFRKDCARHTGVAPLSGEEDGAEG